MENWREELDQIARSPSQMTVEANGEKHVAPVLRPCVRLLVPNDTSLPESSNVVRILVLSFRVTSELQYPWQKERRSPEVRACEIHAHVRPFIG